MVTAFGSPFAGAGPRDLRPLPRGEVEGSASVGPPRSLCHGGTKGSAPALDKLVFPEGLGPLAWGGNGSHPGQARVGDVEEGWENKDSSQ